MNRGCSSLVCGAYSSFAVTLDGALYAWGRNKAGNLGLGQGADVRAPTRVKGALRHARVKSVAAGNEPSAAVSRFDGPCLTCVSAAVAVFILLIASLFFAVEQGFIMRCAWQRSKRMKLS